MHELSGFWGGNISRTNLDLLHFRMILSRGWDGPLGEISAPLLIFLQQVIPRYERRSFSLMWGYLITATPMYMGHIQFDRRCRYPHSAWALLPPLHSTFSFFWDGVGKFWARWEGGSVRGEESELFLIEGARARYYNSVPVPTLSMIRMGVCEDHIRAHI